jgi:hypothetical protein
MGSDLVQSHPRPALPQRLAQPGGRDGARKGQGPPGRGGESKGGDGAGRAPHSPQGPAQRAPSGCVSGAQRSNSGQSGQTGRAMLGWRRAPCPIQVGAAAPRLTGAPGGCRAGAPRRPGRCKSGVGLGAVAAAGLHPLAGCTAGARRNGVSPGMGCRQGWGVARDGVSPGMARAARGGCPGVARGGSAPAVALRGGEQEQRGSGA